MKKLLVSNESKNEKNLQNESFILFQTDNINNLESNDTILYERLGLNKNVFF